MTLMKYKSKYNKPSTAVQLRNNLGEIFRNRDSSLFRFLFLLFVALGFCGTIFYCVYVYYLQQQDKGRQPSAKSQLHKDEPKQISLTQVANDFSGLSTIEKFFGILFLCAFVIFVVFIIVKYVFSPEFKKQLLNMYRRDYNREENESPDINLYNDALTIKKGEKEIKRKSRDYIKEIEDVKTQIKDIKNEKAINRPKIDWDNIVAGRAVVLYDSEEVKEEAHGHIAVAMMAIDKDGNEIPVRFLSFGYHDNILGYMNNYKKISALKMPKIDKKNLQRCR